jgi:hypothetical protein
MARPAPLVGLVPNSFSGMHIFDLLGAGVNAAYRTTPIYFLYIFITFGGLCHSLF